MMPPHANGPSRSSTTARGSGTCREQFATANVITSALVRMLERIGCTSELTELTGHDCQHKTLGEAPTTLPRLLHLFHQIPQTLRNSIIVARFSCFPFCNIAHPSSTEVFLVSFRATLTVDRNSSIHEDDGVLTPFLGEAASR